VTRIAVLVHDHDRSFDATTSTIGAMAQRWRASGASVVVAQGARDAIEADVVINHVDLTVTPRSYRRYLQRFPVGINRELVDISKPLVSSHLLERPDDDGPVIVKTSANAGGGRDLALAAQTSLRDRVAWKLARATSDDLARARYLPASGYPVFASARDVPAGVWRNRHLVVERFLTERVGDDHVVRAWWFFGTRGLNTWIRACDPIAKGDAITDRRILDDPPPPVIEETRRRLHADYGRIDYAIVDGEAVVYDVNRTPTLSEGARAVYGDQIVALADGLDDYVR
jgi:hypothetical protein